MKHGESRPDIMRSGASGRKDASREESPPTELSVRTYGVSKAEKAERKNEGGWLRLFDEAPVGLVVFDPEGIVVEANACMSGLLGVKKESLAGVPFSRFLTKESEAAFSLYMGELTGSGDEKLCELTLVKEDGSLVSTIARSSRTKKKKGLPGTIRAAFMSLDVNDSARHWAGPAAALKTFGDNVPDGIFRLDHDFRHVFTNPVMHDLSGLRREALLDASLDDWAFLPREMIARVKRLVRKAFRTREPQETEVTCDRAGSPAYLHVRLVPEAGTDGKIGTVLGILCDITRLKRNEADIQAEHSFREAISRSLSIGIGAIDDQGKQLYVNPAFCRIVGWSSEELLGRRFPYAYWPHDEVRKARKIFLKIRKGKKTSGSFELNLQRRDGTRFDALIMYSAFYDNSGNRIGWIGSVGDISGLKRKEKELQRLNRDLDAMVRKRTESLRVQNRNLRDILMGLNKAQEELRLSETRVLLEKQRLETILNVIPAGVIVVEGREGRIAYVNRRAQTFFGHRPASGFEMVGNIDQFELLKPDGNEAYSYEELPLNRSLVNGETIKGEEMVLVRPDGQHIAILANTTPLAIGGEIVGAVASFVDITEMKRSEESIKTLNTELAKNLLLVEDTNKELEGFMQSVTHDLKSPLIVINGFSRRLLELPPEGFEEKSHEYVEYIRETSQNALFLVRDLLRLFKISKGEINRTTVDLAEMSRSLEQYFRGLYPGRTLKLIAEEHLKVPGDFNLLKIVMENLIGNSYKFTANNDGEAIVELGSHQAKEGLVVFVRDNGCGFDMDRARRRLFEPFARFHNENEYKGTGIGLATVKRIVHRHGGRIWAESQPGQGATFYFTLPD